jgi:hypothetical protein
MGDLEFIAERDPRIIFDRHGGLVCAPQHSQSPYRAKSFKRAWRQRFADSGRDGLPSRSSDGIRQEASANPQSAPQMELFVSDERSAIDWLSTS